MATQWDIQQAQQQKTQTISSSLMAQSAPLANALITNYYSIAQPPQSVLGTIIEAVGAFAIAGMNYLSGKKQQEAALAEQQKETDTTNYVNKTLDTIYKSGKSLIIQGLSPQSPNFEKSLTQSLYNTVGYKGNCNIDLLGIPPAGSTIKPLWLQITNNGTQLQVINQALSLPPNFLSYWSSQCQAIHAQWIQDYTQQIISSKQQAIQQQEQQTISTATLISGSIFGSLALIFFASMLYYSTKVHK